MEIPLLKDIIIIFGLAIVVLFICHRLRVPAVVGFLLTGIVAGPYGLGLIKAIHEVATGKFVCKPYKLKKASPQLKNAIDDLVEKIEATFPGISNARWVALRLLEGDERMVKAVEKNELMDLVNTSQPQELSEIK